jgi:Rab-like protein 5
MSTTSLTIFVIGPSKSGKTAISNYLGDLSESLETSEYQPTQGVRILEFQRKIFADVRKGQKWREATIDGIFM